MATGLVSS